MMTRILEDIAQTLFRAWFVDFEELISGEFRVPGAEVVEVEVV